MSGLVALVSFSLLASGLVAIALASSPAVGTAQSSSFVGWRDDFNDSTKVSELSGVEIADGMVRLRLAPLQRQGPVLSWGPGFDSLELGGPSVLVDAGIHKMWYYGYDGGTYQIAYATSDDGRVWTKQGVVLSPSLPAEAVSIAYPEVIKVGAEYRMWYTGNDGAVYRILAATSADGISWTKQGVVLDVGSGGAPDDLKVWDATVLLQGSTYYMWYTGQSTGDPPRAMILLATSSDGLSWMKQGVVLSSGAAGSLDQDYVANPAVRIVGPFFEMIYMGGSGGLQRLFYARSVDGDHWQKRGLALDVLAPDESPYVVQPTFVVEANGTRSVYYAARGSANRIYYATLPMQGDHGHVSSVAVDIPEGLEWEAFGLTIQTPSGTSVGITVLAARTNTPITGMDNMSAGSFSLTALTLGNYSSILLEGWLSGDGESTPTLDAWQVTWSVPLANPPAPTEPSFSLMGASLLPWAIGAVSYAAAVLVSAIAVLAGRRNSKQPR